MKKIRVGIVGYGNLGRAIKELLENNADVFELVCIFSKREICVKNINIEKTENIMNYKNKIDILFMCGGSSSGLVNETKKCLKYFCTIDAFDNHKKIPKYIKECNKIAIKNRKVSFCCFGWDPGIFSLIRVLLSSLQDEVYTVWGEGLSQGHSEAIRNIDNVKDAIQFTIPNIKNINKIKGGKIVEKYKLHTRKCLVVADKEHQKEIKNKIVNMPNYFKEYKTIVKFVTEKKLNKNKNYYHAGRVFTVGGDYEFKLKTKSNPKTTANIMITFSKILSQFYKKKLYGAYSILDIPIGNLLKNSKKLI